MLSSLLAKYPKDKKKVEKGRDLWELYRPSYIRAFNDAKDYKADTGKLIEGTKSSTADDFVSKGEFRLFCSYLCIYASMVNLQINEGPEKNRRNVFYLSAGFVFAVAV